MLNFTQYLKNKYIKEGEEIVRSLYFCIFPVKISEGSSVKEELREKYGETAMLDYHDYTWWYAYFHRSNDRQLPNNWHPIKILEMLQKYMEHPYHNGTILDYAAPWSEVEVPLYRFDHQEPAWKYLFKLTTDWHLNYPIDNFANLQEAFGFDASYLPNWHPYKKDLLQESKSFTDKKAVFGQL